MPCKWSQLLFPVAVSVVVAAAASVAAAVSAAAVFVVVFVAVVSVVAVVVASVVVVVSAAAVVIVVSEVVVAGHSECYLLASSALLPSQFQISPQLCPVFSSGSLHVVRQLYQVLVDHLPCLSTANCWHELDSLQHEHTMPAA